MLFELKKEVRHSRQKNRNHKTEANKNFRTRRKKTQYLKFKNRWMGTIAEWR